MENLTFMIIALVTGILLIGIYIIIKSNDRKNERKNNSRIVNFTGTMGVNYTAKLIPGRSGNTAKDWRYYRNNPGGDDIEVLDIILYMLLWDIFMGEDGEYMVDDRFYQEDNVDFTETVGETTDIIHEEPEIETNSIDEEDSRRSYEDSYSSNDYSSSTDSYDSYDSGGSDD